MSREHKLIRVFFTSWTLIRALAILGTAHCLRSTVKAMQDIGSGGSDHHAVMTVFEIDTAGDMLHGICKHEATA